MSDHISASTIARIAGNILSGSSEADNAALDDQRVQWAVSIARRIAAEVRRTQEPHP